MQFTTAKRGNCVKDKIRDIFARHEVTTAQYKDVIIIDIKSQTQEMKSHFKNVMWQSCTMRDCIIIKCWDHFIIKSQLCEINCSCKK